MENESTIKCSKCPSGYIHTLSVIHLYWCMYYHALKKFLYLICIRKIVEDMIHFSVFLTLFIFLVLLHEKIKYVYNYSKVR